ncbi:MAG TPA: AAA family ATPase [Candidatus Acidoferrales bacterium]|nr:AAA family ATPase [Candidatus Acidoferrales bacterium]
MIITISGLSGSGKTTVAKALSENLNYKYVSSGDAFRQLACERSMNLEQFSILAEHDPEIDRMIDKRQVDIVSRYKDVIFEGRLSGRIVNGDLKVWLKAPLEVRVKRIAKREQKSYAQACNETRLREISEAKRYLEIYNIDIFNLSTYDLVIDTQHWNQHSVIDIILTAVKQSEMIKR